MLFYSPEALGEGLAEVGKVSGSYGKFLQKIAEVLAEVLAKLTKVSRLTLRELSKKKFPD